jgi:soluble cytochrome b562
VADRRIQKKAGTGEAESPPMTPEQFENLPEFRRFREGMKSLLKVSKAELNRRIEAARNKSSQSESL